MGLTAMKSMTGIKDYADKERFPHEYGLRQKPFAFTQ